MPFSNEELIQKLTQNFPELVWELQGDKFISSVFPAMALGWPPIRITIDGHYLDSVEVPEGYKLSIPRALANEIFEHRAAMAAINAEPRGPRNR